MALNNGRRGSQRNRFGNVVLLLCVFAPSVWMIANVPPLWRDADAYNQLTRDPLISTFWGWQPAYGYLSKVPLLLTEQIELLTGHAQPRSHPPSEVLALSDSGIASLILAQHLALGISALGFIRAITSVFWLRLVLSLGWASNALFYTFAHCVGSESLSLILIVFLVTRGVRLVQSDGEPGWSKWYLFAITLWLCLLSRQINGLLIFLLPAAFVLAWTQLRIAKFFNASPTQKTLRAESPSLRHAIVAMAIGLACVFVGGSQAKNLASKTKLHPHSRLGYTFLWRLQFLNTLPPEARTSLLNKLTDRTRSPETRKLLTLLSQVQDEGSFSPGQFPPRAAPLLFPRETTVPWEKVDLALNGMAFAFLVPPSPELLQAARIDFGLARTISVTEITDHLFEMTTYFFEHPDEMPSCASLVTFRDYDTEKIMRMPSQLPYFHLWKGLSYNRTLLIWLVSLAGLIGVSFKRKLNVAAIAGFGIALVAVGALMVAITCLLGESLPRYALPMWQMLLLSFWLFVGQAGDRLVKRQSCQTPVAT